MVRRKARETVGMPEGFRFYDLRHTGHALSTRSGAPLKGTMSRAGQSSGKAAPIYQHSDDERQEEVAAGLDATVRKAWAAAGERQREKEPDQPSGTNLARG
jgi:integrase